MAGDQELDQGIGVAVDDDGDELPEETLKEMAAVAEAVATATEVEQAAEAERLAAVERELEAQRAQTRASLGRYREALLAAEPALPPERSGESSSTASTRCIAAASAARGSSFGSGMPPPRVIGSTGDSTRPRMPQSVAEPAVMCLTAALVISSRSWPAHCRASSSSS